jgi:hypothetical protein
MSSPTPLAAEPGQDHFRTRPLTAVTKNLNFAGFDPLMAFHLKPEHL